jgi:hypothetical protein
MTLEINELTVHIQVDPANSGPSWSPTPARTETRTWTNEQTDQIAQRCVEEVLSRLRRWETR